MAGSQTQAYAPRSQVEDLQFISTGKRLEESCWPCSFLGFSNESLPVQAFTPDNCLANGHIGLSRRAVFSSLSSTHTPSMWVAFFTPPSTLGLCVPRWRLMAFCQLHENGVLARVVGSTTTCPHSITQKVPPGAGCDQQETKSWSH